MSLDAAVERFRALGVMKPEQDAQILYACPTTNELLQESKRLHLQSSATQFLGIPLSKIFESDPIYKEKFMRLAVDKLSGKGVSPEEIQGFYNSRGGNWDLFFRVEYDNKYSEEKIDSFIGEATQLALDCIREYLGFRESST